MFKTIGILAIGAVVGGAGMYVLRYEAETKVASAQKQVSEQATNTKKHTEEEVRKFIKCIGIEVEE